MVEEALEVLGGEVTGCGFQYQGRDFSMAVPAGDLQRGDIVIIRDLVVGAVSLFQELFNNL